MALVRSALGGARVAQIGLGLVVAALGWLFTFALDETSSIGYTIFVAVMTGFFALIAALLFYVAIFKSSPNRSPLVRALRDQPDSVVWVYQQDVSVGLQAIDEPSPYTNIITNLADGSTVAISVLKPKASNLLSALRVLAPRAAIGYSEERLAQFKRDPRSLCGEGPP